MSLQHNNIPTDNKYNFPYSVYQSEYTNQQVGIPITQNQIYSDQYNQQFSQQHQNLNYNIPNQIGLPIVQLQVNTTQQDQQNLLKNLNINQQKSFVAGLLILHLIQCILYYTIITFLIVFQQFIKNKNAQKKQISYLILMLFFQGIIIIIFRIKSKIKQEATILFTAILLGLFIFKTISFSCFLLFLFSVGNYFTVFIAFLIYFTSIIMAISSTLVLIYFLIEWQEFYIIRALIGPLIIIILACFYYGYISLLFAPVMLMYSIIYSKQIINVTKNTCLKKNQIFQGAIAIVSPIFFIL